MSRNFSDTANDFVRWYLAAPRGIHLSHPFLDPRLLLQSRHADAPPRRPARQKAVLAQAMRGTLPEAIVNRPAKGHFNEVYFRGLSRNLPALERLLDRAPDLDFLDRDSLRSCLHQAALGTSSSMLGLHRLNVTLSLLAWMDADARGPADPLSPTQIVRLGATVHADGAYV